MKKKLTVEKLTDNALRWAVANKSAVGFMGCKRSRGIVAKILGIGEGTVTSHSTEAKRQRWDTLLPEPEVDSDPLRD